MSKNQICSATSEDAKDKHYILLEIKELKMEFITAVLKKVSKLLIEKKGHNPNEDPENHCQLSLQVNNFQVVFLDSVV